MKLPKHLNSPSVLFIMRTLGLQAFTRLAFSRLLSINHYYIVGKNIPALLQQPADAAARSLAPVSDDDMACIADSLGCYDPAERRALLSRIIFYRRGFTNCYAFREGDDIAYIQWLVFPEENELINKNYSGIYYPLTAKQVMVENAFTFPRYRGRGYFLDGTKQLLELAKEKGYSSAIAYIRKDRIDPLNQFAQLGFRIVKLVTEYKVLGRAWKHF